MDCVLNRNFYEMNVVELEMIEGGSFWGVVGGGLTVIAGAAEVVGGVALCLVPEPTMATKVGGGAAIVTGASTVIGGIVQIASNF